MKNNKEVKAVVKETIILTAITLIAGLMLGFIYELTKEPIALQQEKAVQSACMAVFPAQSGQEVKFNKTQYTPSEELKGKLSENGVSIGAVFEAVSEGELQGYVVETTSSEGYGGNIVLYVGVTLEGKINDVSILSISETPGLGMQAQKVLVPQFHEKIVPQFSFTKNGSQSDSEIDAISGATITTKAVTNAVNGALSMAAELNHQ